MHHRGSPAENKNDQADKLHIPAGISGLAQDGLNILKSQGMVDKAMNPSPV
jgi:hypothetical protein